MPRGQANQTGKFNPNQIANLPNKKNCAEFFIVEDVKTEEGMSLPDKKTFDKLVNTATLQLLEYNEDWVQTIEFADLNRGGIGVLVLNYGNQVAADRVREYIVRQSTALVSYQTYPIGDMMKRYAVTAFIHAGNYLNLAKTKVTNYSPTPNNLYTLLAKYSPKETKLITLLFLPLLGLEFLPSVKIGPLLKKCNPEIKGTFTVVDCRTLTEEGKAGCRIVSIEGSPEFMDYLATVPKQQQFKILHKKIYVNGGKRSDSLSEYTAPKLTHAASTQLVKGVNDLIMKSASKMHGASRAQPDNQYSINKITLENKLTKTILTLSNIGRTMDQIMDEDEGSTAEAPPLNHGAQTQSKPQGSDQKQQANNGHEQGQDGQDGGQKVKGEKFYKLYVTFMYNIEKYIPFLPKNMSTCYYQSLMTSLQQCAKTDIDRQAQVAKIYRQKTVTKSDRQKIANRKCKIKGLNPHRYTTNRSDVPPRPLAKYPLQALSSYKLQDECWHSANPGTILYIEGTKLKQDNRKQTEVGKNKSKKDYPLSRMITRSLSSKESRNSSNAQAKYKATRSKTNQGNRKETEPNNQKTKIDYPPSQYIQPKASNIKQKTERKRKKTESKPPKGRQPLKTYERGIKISTFGAQRLINLEIPVLVRSLKSSNVELG